MKDTLRRLHSLIPSRPRLIRASGIDLAEIDDHCIQFDSNPTCQFFLLAYDAIPALLEEISTLEARLGLLGNGLLVKALTEIEALKTEREAMKAEVAKVQADLATEVEARTTAAKAARAGNLVARKFIELSKENSALRAELDVARTQTKT